MSSTAPISDPIFRRAVELLDRGDAASLREWIEAHPQLMKATACDDPSTYGDYFVNARLLWFVAENPTRNGVLPANITDVTRTLIDMGRQLADDDLTDQLNYTLALVTSSLVARECNQQRPLIEVLVAGGADPNSGVQSAVAHRELDACLGMLENGAELTLPLAAGLGRTKDLIRLTQSADQETLQEALTMAAINLQPACVTLLLEHDVDVNRFNPKGAHAHSTPLHQAVYGGCAETVDVLLGHGADPFIQDKIFDSNSIEWASHEGHHELAKRMEN